MPAVNPEILVWARETAGLTLQEAAPKVGIRDARGVAAADRLAALERGEKEPTRPLLVRMAKRYHRPLLVFYLKAPPRPDDRGPDFRTLPGARSPQAVALVRALVRNVQSRQGMVRAALEAEDEAERLPFVGALLRSEETANDIESVRRALGHKGTAAGLLQRAAKELRHVLGDDLDAAKYYRQPDADEAFRLLRSRAENAGVFVLLQGDLGSHHTDIDVDLFRGFAIADDIAPFVVINDNDSRAAWSFTLLHELTHLLLDQTGFSPVHAGRDIIEEFCDGVAANWLLPPGELDEIELRQRWSVDEQQRHVGEFARTRNLSGTMVAYQLLLDGRIDRPTFDRLRANFREQWRLGRDRQRAKARQSEGGPNYYVVRRHRVGPRLLGFARRMLDSGALSTTRTARILAVKPTQVGNMLRPA